MKSKWSWNPFSYFFNGSDPEDVEPLTSFVQEDFVEYPTILDLPPELRNVIWKNLDVAQLKVLRQVCQTFCHEIDTVVGVNALLHGPKLWRDWTFSDELNFILSFGNCETRRIDENLRWIENVLVRGLNLKRLAEIPLNPSTLLQVPFILHRLVVELEEGTPWNDLTNLLALCTNLGLLHISCTPHRPKLNSPFELVAYQEFAGDFTVAVLRQLRGLNTLKELSINVIKDASLMSAYNLSVFRGLPDSLIIGRGTLYPMRLDVLKLSFPINLNTFRLVEWREFFEGQDDLKELKLEFEFIYWQFYSQVLAKNAGTLRSLDICLSNFIHDRNPEVNEHEQNIPPNEQLNWQVLFGPLQELEFLKINMSDYYPRFLEHPYGTRGFSQTYFPYLVTLELHSMNLDQPDIYHIFHNFPSLKILDLSYFTPWQGFLTYIHQANVIFSMVAVVLGHGRMDMITFTDWCVRHYPRALRETIETHHATYISVWPKGREHTVASHFCDSKNLFKVQRIGTAVLSTDTE